MPGESGSPQGDPECDCNAAVWANTLMGLGIGSGVLTIVSSILALLLLSSPVLNAYLVALGLVAIATELRKFAALRPLVYHVVKYFYFITSWSGKAIFYIFVGTIQLDPTHPLALIAGVFMIFIGFAIFVVRCKYTLPKYWDLEEKKREMEEQAARDRKKLEEEYEKKLRAATAVAAAANPAGPDAMSMPTLKTGHGSPPAAVRSRPMTEDEFYGDYDPPKAY